MTNTPRGAPELASSQAVPETTVNEQIRRTEAGAGRYPVADRVTAPPGSCADGANYIIIAPATGAFAGKEGQIATAVGTNAAGGWYYRTLGTIDEGVLAYVQDEDLEYKWGGSAWATYSGSGYFPGGTDVAIADGGTGASSAGAALTNLGGTTVGVNVFTLTNPSAITFPRLNADNSVSALSASAFRTAIGAGTGNGGGDLLSTNNLSDLASATTARTNLGLGTSATVNTGTSGATIPLLNGANTHSGLATFSAGIDLTPAATPSTTAAGYLGSPQNTQNGAYTTVMSDAGKHLYHTSGSAHTWTIDSNANVAYPIGTILTFINENGGGNVTLAITSDTLRWGSSTGSRTLAANGTATAIKVASTTWRLTGDGIT